MLFLAKTNIHKYPIATMFFGYSYLYKYTYKIGNGNPIPPKSKKSNKTDFYRIYILYVYCMYVCSSSRILLKATAENSCEGFRSSFTYPLLLSLSLFLCWKSCANVQSCSNHGYSRLWTNFSIETLLCAMKDSSIEPNINQST